MATLSGNSLEFIISLTVGNTRSENDSCDML